MAADCMVYGVRNVASAMTRTGLWYLRNSSKPGLGCPTMPTNPEACRGVSLHWFTRMPQQRGLTVRASVWRSTARAATCWQAVANEDAVQTSLSPACVNS